ncbi:MAG: Eco57I restriction-modification methylase domain-containing protein, partial [Bacteroidota bacterium]
MPALRWPPSTVNPDEWRAQWLAAFDKQKLTEAFFKEYRALFGILQADLAKQTKDLDWAHDYSLQFLNRCMFLYFIQRKRWLGNDPAFLKNFWSAYENAGQSPDTFYSRWLSVLFFEAFNNKFHGGHEEFPGAIRGILQLAPYLNGGLFDQNELDRKHSFQLSDQRFRQVLGFLERYNFTVNEDTPLDQEVAVDAEMLGRVYESLVNLSEGADERGDAGIFYTPRTEIDLMCRLSVVDHLANQLGGEWRSSLYDLVFAFSPDDKHKADQAMEHGNKWGEIDLLLSRVAAVDPACGSGSFLIGMLQVLDDLAERANRVLGRPETPYERRKRIIGQSLYGVDVMRWAVEVAELRLWLQLVIETDLQPAELKFRPLLPNLSFKVRCGDSLLQEVGGVNIGHRREAADIHPALKGRLTSLKGEKLKFFNNDKEARFKTRASLEKEEYDIFRDILESRLRDLGNQLRAKQGILSGKTTDMFGGEIDSIQGAERDEVDAQVEVLVADMERARTSMEALRRTKAPPFVWDVAFVEVFEGERQGFDIVIGNPPYVRQERISDPGMAREGVTVDNKRIYKDKLASSVYVAYPRFFGYNASSGSVRKKLDAKSDLYVYFYLHSLALLNPRGVLCFITSNSWLDVGYGADLQEFLLSECHVRMIVDNQSRRSFASADVNTAIALLSAPRARAGWALEAIVRFIQVKVPFEDILTPVVFAEIEGATLLKETPEYRVFPITQRALLEDGSRSSDDDDEISSKAV